MLALGCFYLIPPTTAGAQLPGGVPVSVYLTDPGLVRAALSPEPDVVLSPDPLPRSVRLIGVNDSTHYQSIIGFGAAMTDTSAWLIGTQLTPTQQQTLLNELFSPTSGIGLNFVNLPIGGSDFTATGDPYTYDDLAPGETDPTLQDFSIAHDQPYVIPVLQQMLLTNPGIDLFASDWTAPAWMKGNDAFDSIGSASGLLPEYARTFGNYLADFIEAYQSDGIPIWALSPQNEPDGHFPYPGMYLTGAEEANLIRWDIAPAFAQDGIHTRIYASATDYTDQDFSADVVQSAAGQLVSGAAWHCYAGLHSISQFHSMLPSAQNLVTECANYLTPYSPAEAAIDALRNWASTFSLWTVAVDQNDGPVNPNSNCLHCGGLVTVDDGQTSEPNPTLNRSYYQLGQFSAFIQRGAVRIETPRWVHDLASTASGTSGVSAGLDNVAFVNPDGTRVLVVYNNSYDPGTFGVQWHSLQFRYSLRAGAIVTFVWQGAKPAQPSACLNASVTYRTATSAFRGERTLQSEPDCGASR